MACASRYVGNSGSHCGLRDVGDSVWVTICGYVTVHYGALRLCVTLVRYGGALRCGTTVRYGCALRCVTLRYGALRCVTVRYGCALRCGTVRYGAFQDYVTDALRRCVTVRYGYVTVSYASPCSKLGLRFHMTMEKPLMLISSKFRFSQSTISI